MIEFYGQIFRNTPINIYSDDHNIYLFDSDLKAKGDKCRREKAAIDIA